MRLKGRRKKRFFRVKRGSKVFIPVRKGQIVIPFRKISLVLIFFLSVACVYLAFRSDVFLVYSVENQIEKEPGVALDIFDREKKEAEELIKDRVWGRSIFFLNQASLRQEILEKFLSLADVSLAKDLPNKVLVTTVFREPIAAVRFIKTAPDSERLATFSAKQATASAFLRDYFVVDKTGVVFTKLSTFSGLPVFFLYDQEVPDLGENIGQKRIRAAGEIVQALGENQTMVDKVFITAFGSLDMFLGDGTKVLFSSQKETADQVASLQLILSSTKMEEKRPKTIDLRFAKPVVKY